MSRGGRRKGAGGKEGQIKPNFFAFVTPEDIKEYMDWVKANYKKDKKLAVWYGDHLFGKPVQPIGNDDDKPFKVEGVKITFRE